GFAEHHTRIVHQVAGGKVVAAVDDHVIVGENLQRVLAGEHGLMRYHGDVRVDVFQRAAGGLSLRAADVVGEVHHLPVQVGQIDTVGVDAAGPAGRRTIRECYNGEVVESGGQQWHQMTSMT